MNTDKGFIFNIQKFSVHDGPGIRTIVFFKGCPLSCKWCSNPEGISINSELSYKKSKCIGVRECAYCIKICPEHAIEADENHLAVIDRIKCTQCMKCVEICPALAIETIGQWMSVEEIINEVIGDVSFYKRSGGGITLSGGEPLLQAPFVVKLLDAAHAEGLETAIETTAYVSWEQAEPVFERLDFVYMDIKTVDANKHFAFTNHDNALILENFRKLCSQFPNKPIIARTPVIPGFNDNVDALQANVDFINEAGKNCSNLSIEFLPFHNFGSAKYENQGKSYAFSGYGNMDKKFVKKLREKMVSKIPILEVR